MIGNGRTGRFLLEPRAYLMDEAVLCMGLNARGAYSTLLMHLWDLAEPGVVKDDDRVLATLARATPDEWLAVKPEVAAAFDTASRPGWWVQKRMVRVHAEQTLWLRGRRAAGSRGGKAKAANRMTSSPVAHAQHKPSGVGVGVGVGVEESKTKTCPPDGGRNGGQLALDGTPPRGKQASAARAEWQEAFTEDFWPQYPRKVAKPRALRAWVAVRPWSQSMCQAIYDGLQVWVEHWKDEVTPARLIPHPATWLNDRRWEDKP